MSERYPDNHVEVGRRHKETARFDGLPASGVVKHDEDRRYSCQPRGGGENVTDPVGVEKV